MTTDSLIVLTTCDSAVIAGQLAGALVEERLAACVTELSGARSTYRWEGALVHSEEVLLIIKTTRQRYAELEARIRSLSGYALPEIVALPVAAGLPGYLDWIHNETA